MWQCSASTIYTGSSSLLEGANKVDKGTSELSKASSALKGGAYQLSENATKLKSATDTIYNGSGALLYGTMQLNTGATQLAKVSTQLKKGTTELSTNSTKILKGTEDLNSGAKELYTGTKKLKTEGLDKLYDLGNEKLSEMDGILEATDKIIEISNDYDNYGGITENMEGNVKFIMKVDDNSSDETSNSANQKEKVNTEEKNNGGFMNWIKSILK